jgi:MFS transporter, PAT family, beta-lactamase induction signal transducer AmpG
MTLNRKLVLVSLVYFAEGMPYGIVKEILPVYFRIHGMSLSHIGLLSLLMIPYALKFLWAPAVDFLGTRRHWIAFSQFLMAGLLIALLPLDPSRPDFLLWAYILSFTILSATQDIAIDAYTIEMLSTSEMGMANGVRQASYRAAIMLTGGLFVAFGGHYGWKLMYLIAGGILWACSVISIKLPPVEVQRPSFSLRSLVEPIRDLWLRPGVVQVLAFILLYKLGDLAIGPMIKPFWLDRGLTTHEIGLITGLVGVLAAVVGGLAGGVFITRYGIFHGLWFLGLWQSVSNLSYVACAIYPDTGHWAIYIASVIESFCGGLGTSAFLAFLMAICKKEFSATQYALLSALFQITGILAGSFSGAMTTQMGYAAYFFLTFLLSLPAFLFVFHARAWIPVNGDEHNEEPALGQTVEQSSS